MKRDVAGHAKVTFFKMGSAVIFTASLRLKNHKKKTITKGGGVVFPAANLKKQPAFTEKNPQGNTAHHEAPTRAISDGEIFAWQRRAICIKA